MASTSVEATWSDTAAGHVEVRGSWLFTDVAVTTGSARLFGREIWYYRFAAITRSAGLAALRGELQKAGSVTVDYSIAMTADVKKAFVVGFPSLAAYYPDYPMVTLPNSSGRVTIDYANWTHLVFVIRAPSVSTSDFAKQNVPSSFSLTGSFDWQINTAPEQAPIIGVPDDITVGNDRGQSGAVVNYDIAANDDVDGAVPVTCSPSSGSFFPIGTTIVTCTATDTSGNTVADYFRVTVLDNEAPVIIVPDDITVPNDLGTGGAIVNFEATATDNNLNGSLAVEYSVAPGSFFPIGTTTVICTATDTAGNTAAASFNVTVFPRQPDIFVRSVTRDDSNNIIVEYEITGKNVGRDLYFKSFESHDALFDSGDRGRATLKVTPLTKDLAGNYATKIGTHRVRMPAKFAPDSRRYVLAVADNFSGNNNRIAEFNEGNNVGAFEQIVAFVDRGLSTGYIVQEGKVENGKPVGKTIFLIKGFIDAFDAPDFAEATIVANRRENQEARVIVVNWANAANPFRMRPIDAVNTDEFALNYDVASLSVPRVGGEIAQWMVQQGVDPRTTEILGHSLGAQVAANIGRRMGGQLARIVAADPAGPVFEGLNENERLDASDAQWVVVIHTTKAFGDQRVIGNVDQYVSSPLFLPNFAHTRAWDLLIKSVQDRNFRGSGFGYNASTGTGHSNFLTDFGVLGDRKLEDIVNGKAEKNQAAAFAYWMTVYGDLPRLG